MNCSQCDSPATHYTPVGDLRYCDEHYTTDGIEELEDEYFWLLYTNHLTTRR